MADDQDPESKTEEASGRKLEEARKKGDVAKSPDVASWLSLAAAVSVLAVAGGPMSRTMADALTAFIAQPHEMIGALESGAGGQIATRALMAGAPLILAVMFATMLAGAGGNVLQTGFLWSPDKLKPDFGKVSPMKGWQRIFGIDGFVNFFKTLLKVIATGWVAWRVMEPHAQELTKLTLLPPVAVLILARDLMLALAGSTLAFLGATALIDWIWQRQRFLKRMRMTKEEVKEDYKQTEGDPHVKGKQKQIRMERARRRMMANVPKATVVITNPTHYAVALRYVAGETAAPQCMAKGMDAIALKIREVAGQHDIPIIEDPPLARALYATVDVDETITQEHYDAVAKVIGFLMSKKNKRPAVPGPAMR